MAVTDSMSLSMTPAVRDSAVLKGDAKDQSIIKVSLLKLVRSFHE